jgi:hypothetical protein
MDWPIKLDIILFLCIVNNSVKAIDVHDSKAAISNSKVFCCLDWAIMQRKLIKGKNEYHWKTIPVERTFSHTVSKKKENCS